MKKTLFGVLSVAVVLSAFALVPASVAQEEAPEMTPEQAAMMEAFEKAGTPGEAHAKLAEMEGTYDLEIKSWWEPGGEPMVSQGTAERKMILDGHHLEEKVTSDMMGEPFHGLGMTGYDNVTDTYWSTWIDSMSTGLMTMTGEWNADKKAWVWEGESSDPMTGSTKAVHMHIYPTETGERGEFYEKHGGEMVKTMEIVYTKK